MESIVLHSDIVRLVFGYFVNNNLRRAALTLCRTSPHLHQEFIALRQGLQPHNFLKEGLEDIIREHVRITSMVTNAVKKLPNETRQRLQQLKLSERVDELLKLNKASTRTRVCSKDGTACIRNVYPNTQRKRRRVCVHSPLGEEQTNSAAPSPSERVNCKRRRLLEPHLYCSIGRSNHLEEEKESLDNSTASELTSEHTDDTLHFRHGHVDGPKNNSTPRTPTSEEAELVMPTPQTMPELTQAIMTNREFQNKLLSNINIALQSLTVHAPTAESVNSEAVLDGLVRNILEATEKDPSFDRIIQEVVGMDTLTDEPIPAAEASAEIAPAEIEPAPPQTPLIIRTAVASANAAAGSVNASGDVNMVNGGNGNAIIQINANSSIGTLIDPNFSISKLIVLNSNESAQKQNQMQSSNNPSFGSENLIRFADGGSTLADADSVGNVGALAGGQVCVDATNGQLTFPMFLSNEGLLSHLPFLVNNEWLAQQLRSDTITNMDVSHIEIPLPEPITVAVNQLPPNSIIINSAVKQQLTTVEEPSVEPPAQLIEEQKKTVVTGNTTLPERSASKVSTASAVPASLDLSRLVLERVTPSTSGIVNVKAFRSLSTPRKRTSHVRTLNFSPKGIPHLQGSTPLSTRRLQQKPQTQRRTQLKTLEGKKAEEFKETGLHPENIVLIKNMEALQSFGTTPSVPPDTNANAAIVDATALPTPAGVCGNESNGCVPPLFVMEECSNQTVIKAATAYKQLKLATNTSDTMVTTPKRKQKRSAATNACKRIISQAAIQDEPNVQQQMEIEKGVSNLLDDSKENESLPTTLQKQLPEQKTELNKEKEDLLAAWQRQMNSTSVDLELRLREINAKRQEVLQNKTSVRRTRPAGANKKKALALSSPLTPLTTKKRKQNQKKKQHLSSNNTEGELNIKITTPHKPPVKPEFVSQHQKELKEVKKPKEVEKPKDSKKIKDKTTKESVETEQNHEPERVQQIQQHLQQPEALKMNIKKNKPADCNMANMAVLLDTPFKVSVKEGVGDVPPTPEPMLMDTPFAKLLPSTSFLFGSDTKSILDTPMLTAITPGMRLMTPFGHVLGTPHSSAAKTDYSSGSSYYRPDEADHTETNAQSALPSVSPRDLLGQIPKQTTTCFELHAERVPVEPMVLRRVHSFGSEAVDSVEGAAALYRNGKLSTQLVETPHYKLVAGLPDVVDHSISSLSGSSSTSSSSSSSSSSGSSSNSNTINTSASSAPSGQMTSATTPARMLKLLALENLSDISSTEDEEWLKVATGCGSLDAPPLAIDSEPAQLVSQDGEVRYPLRSWLTPSKEAGAAAAAAVAEVDTSGETAPPAPEPLKLVPNVKSPNIGKLKEESAEQRIMDLAEVCERVKAKFKQQKTPKGRPRTVNKRLTTMRETSRLTNPNRTHTNNSPKNESTSVNTVKKSKVSNIIGPRNHETSPSKSMKPKLATPSEVIESILEKIEPSNSNLDPALLFALNLSAKKQQQQQQPNVGRTAVQIEAQPVPSTTMGQRRGRPKKPPNLEPTRGSMRRSSRLIDNKTPAPEEPQPIGSEAAKPVKISNNTKVTKKPAKKRANARIETAAPPLAATLAEAQTTQQSTAKLQPRRQPPASITAPDASGDYDLDMCLSSCHVSSTYSFVYSDSGYKAVHAVPWQPPSFFKNFQMRIMVDSEMHNVRITSPQLLHQSLGVSVDDSANPTCIRNIPKKRIIRFTSGGGDTQELASAPNLSLTSSTPLAKHTQGEEHDDNDMEVASINTPLKANTSEEQQMEGHDAGVQIEDIESILSHLHGT